jgi:hypothetical protein
MTVVGNLPAALCIPAGVILATLAVACGGEPVKSPNSSSVANSTSTSAAEFNGTYDVTYEGGATSRWTVTPCGTGCANIVVKPETESEGLKVEPPQTRGAHLEGDSWIMAYVQMNGYVCDDGTETAMDAIQTWDATSLKGTFDATLHGPGCGQPAGSDTGPPESFTLDKVS